MLNKLFFFLLLIFFSSCQNSNYEAVCKDTISAQKQLIEGYKFEIDSINQKLQEKEQHVQRLQLIKYTLTNERDQNKQFSRNWDSLKNIIKQAKRKEEKYLRQINEYSEYDDFIKEENLIDEIQIAKPGVFYKNDVEDSLKNLDWFGLYKDGDKFYIKKTEITIEPAIWGYLETSEKEAKKISATSGEKPFLLISGLKNLKEGFIESIPEKIPILYPGEYRSIKINKIRTKLFASGTFLTNGSVIEYFLNISARKKLPGQSSSKYFNQVFAGINKTCGNTIYSILWAGDIDQDGELDLILELDCGDAGSYKIELFLSSKAEKGKLLKKAAEWRNIVHRGC